MIVKLSSLLTDSVALKERRKGENVNHYDKVKSLEEFVDLLWRTIAEYFFLHKWFFVYWYVEFHEFVILLSFAADEVEVLVITERTKMQNEQ